MINIWKVSVGLFCIIYVAVFGFVEVLHAAPGDITTVAGGGINDGASAAQAGLLGPWDVVVDDRGDVYVTDWRGNRIRKIEAETGMITTVIGDGVRGVAREGDGGSALRARVDGGGEVSVDRSGNIYFTGGGLRRINTMNMVTTIAGAGLDISDGVLAQLSLGTIRSVYVDDGNDIYVAQQNRLRKIDSRSGVITTLAGDGIRGYLGDGGRATDARMNVPRGIFVDQSGHVYFADQSNHIIRRVDARTGIITTIAGNGLGGYSGDGGPASRAALNTPRDVYVDKAGNVYFSDTFNHRVRRVDFQGIITTVAGNGEAGFAGDGNIAIDARLNVPIGVSGDGDGNLYIADRDNGRIRKVTPDGLISTFAGGFIGDGKPAVEAALSFPSDVFVDTLGHLYIGDQNRGGLVRRVDAQTGFVKTIAGGGSTFDDGVLATSTRLNDDKIVRADGAGIWMDGAGNLYVANNHRVRKVDVKTGIITTVAGTGTAGFDGDGGLAIESKLNNPYGIFIDSMGDLYIADMGNHCIRKVDPSGKITTVAGNGIAGFLGDGGLATEARLNAPRQIFIDENGDLYIADTENHRIRVVRTATGEITTFAGVGELGVPVDGVQATEAEILRPYDVFIDGAGDMFVAESDEDRNRVRKVSGETGLISTVAGTESKYYFGDGGLATEAGVWTPRSVFVDGRGDLYIADLGNHRIRKVEAVAAPTTLNIGTFLGPTNPPITQPVDVSFETIQRLDANVNGVVDFADFLLFSQQFGLNRDDVDFNDAFDIDDSGHIDFIDFITFAKYFGQSVNN